MCCSHAPLLHLTSSPECGGSASGPKKKKSHLIESPCVSWGSHHSNVGLLFQTHIHTHTRAFTQVQTQWKTCTLIRSPGLCVIVGFRVEDAKMYIIKFTCKHAEAASAHMHECMNRAAAVSRCRSFAVLLLFSHIYGEYQQANTQHNRHIWISFGS